jgi:predicted PurR-regulated permease PerM
MKSYPTPWQKKVLWSALTALAMAFIASLFLGAFLAVKNTLGYLQPILTPVAVAGILAYLLNPLVDKLVRRGVPRPRGVIYVFALVFVPMVLLGIWIVPKIYDQSMNFAKEVPALIEKGRAMSDKAVQQYQLRYSNNPWVKEGLQQVTDWTQKQLPELPMRLWRFIIGGAQGFLGAFGLLLGLVVIPVYLYFFLVNADPIAQHWSDYIPLRASAFKDELVSCLNEINDYLIAFFRGQILVTMIDGALLAVALLAINLNFALLIGLAVAFLQLIPFFGVIVCWIPAVIIAAIQFQDWQHPLWVTLIFFVVTHLDGLIIAPRIVGESVGLHPMTIIVSVLVWSLVFGGILGALLAVPLTATLKVLLRRYVWEKRFRTPQTMETPPTVRTPPLAP